VVGVSSPRVARVAASGSLSSSAFASVDAARLRRNADIAAVRSEGRRLQHELFSLRARPNGAKVIRLAISAPRILGRSVARNRARRRLREAFRIEIVPLEMTGHDLLIVARTSVATADHAALRTAAREALRRLDGQG
jgi:ribonuclease P protein component